MHSNKPFSALILAGGKSSRMGQDKAELRFNGRSLLAHMQQLAEQTGAVQVLISRNQPGFIQDSVAQQGPLAGILAALAHCTAPQLLILPIDTPLLSISSLQLLLQRAGNNAAHFNDSPLPCVLPATVHLAALLKQQLQNGQRSVYALLTQLNAAAVPAAENELTNTNTPQDWQRCLANIGSKKEKAPCLNLI